MGEFVAIGVDLAWSDRNLTGGAVIVDGTLVDARADLRGNDTIVAWVEGWLGEGASAVVAVDAPLRVPNATGKRRCEDLLGQQWRKYQAGPYPSNRTLFKNDVRGERLVHQLADQFGFVESTEIVAAMGARYVCEVFPHPAHVSLFQRQQILKYKKKARRTYPECWAGLDEYQALLRGLANALPPLRDPQGMLNATFAEIRGKGLKALEDQLDAVTCAYVASYLWQHGAAGTWVYGDVANGHILVPRNPPLQP